jgi:hypothetical protein
MNEKKQTEMSWQKVVYKSIDNICATIVILYILFWIKSCAEL